MEVSSLDKIKEQLRSLNRSLDEAAIFAGEFEPIECELFSVILSAGIDTFSSPRTYAYNKIDEYVRVQVIIQEKSKLQSDMIVVLQPQSDDRFKMFGWSKYFSYTDYRGKSLPGSIGSYIPIEELPQLIRDVFKISKLKMFF